MKNKMKIMYLLLFTVALQLVIVTRYSIPVSASEIINEVQVRNSCNEDIDNNGVIDILDLSIIASRYNLIKGTIEYNSNYDLNGDGIIDVYDLIMVSKKIGTSISLEAGSYDEKNALIKYVGSWNSQSNTSHSGGSIKYSSTKGDYAEIKFYGTGIDIYSLYGTNQGKANIYIDGKLVATKDLYQAKSYYNKLSYYNHSLTLGEHVLKIEVTGQANSASTANNVSIDRIEIINNNIANSNYKVYQGNNTGSSWYIGQYETKEAAIKEASLYSLTYVNDSDGKEIWTNSYRVYQRLVDGTILSVKGLFKTKDEAVAIAKQYEWGYVADTSGEDVWNRGYPAKIKTAILESYGPSTAYAKGTVTLSVGKEVTIINKEGAYYLVEYKSTLGNKRIYVPTANVTVSSKYTINTAVNMNTVMYSKSAQNVNGGPGLLSIYPKIGSIEINEKVNELYKENGYSLIEYDTSSGRKRGYVLSSTLTSSKPVTIGYVYNVGNTLNVRKGPSTGDTILGKLNYGEKVEIVDSSNFSWHKINYDGGYGYVHKDYITFTKPSSSFPHSLDYYVDIQMNLSAKPQAYVNGGGWRNATKSEVKYYMNPANFTENDGKYMFMKLSYFDGVPLSSIKNVLSTKGVLAGKESVFLNAAKKYNVNPLYLIYHAILETGHGISQLSTGILVNGRKVYNMFGIGALDSDPIGTGSEYAYKQGWFTPELAITGGAQWISSRYINSSYNQDTLYKMRWNLTPLGGGVHQYATDVKWAYNQSKLMASFIQSVQGIKLEFEIPTFKSSLWNTCEVIRRKSCY